MPSCVFVKCRNHSREKNKSHGITFHSLPRHTFMLHKWIKIIRTQRREYDWCPNKHSKICLEHFSKSDFYETKKKLCRLKNTAIPVIKKIGESFVGYLDEDIYQMTIENTEEEVADDTEKEIDTFTTDGKRQRKYVSRHIINNIEYEDIDKFAEQIAFLLKRIPRKLCKKLQDSIVTLVKTETIKYENYLTKKNVIASTSATTKEDKPVSQHVLSPTLDKVNEIITTKQEYETMSHKEEEEEEEERPVDKTKQAAQHLEKPFRKIIWTDKPSFSNITFPKPMTLPIELVGSLDCVKQEPLDPDDDIIEQEENNEITTPISEPDLNETDIATTFIEEENRRESLEDKYD